MQYNSGLLVNNERPLLPTESYLIKTYGQENGNGNSASLGAT